MISALKQVQEEADADVIIAEPVGSCTDLSATIIQPLKEYMQGELLVSPLTVMADPFRLADIMDGNDAGLHPSAAYIFRKQLEESDIILISKSDLIAPLDLEKLKIRAKLNFPDSEVMSVSSLSRVGLDQWLNEVLNRTDSGKRLVEVDYDIYAEGEKVLGWLNATIMLTGEPTDWDSYVRNFLISLSQQFDSMEASVGHVKIMLEAGSHYLLGNLTDKEDTINFRGSAGIGSDARMTLNARVEMNPEVLEIMIRDSLEATRGSLETKILALRCLSPGRPEPTFRFKYVVPLYK